MLTIRRNILLCHKQLQLRINFVNYFAAPKTGPVNFRKKTFLGYLTAYGVKHKLLSVYAEIILIASYRVRDLQDVFRKPVQSVVQTSGKLSTVRLTITLHRRADVKEEYQ